MSSSRYPLYSGVVFVLFLVRGYGEGTKLFPETAIVIEHKTLQLDCFYEDGDPKQSSACQWSKNGVHDIVAIIDENCFVINLFPDIYNFKCTNRTVTTMFINSTDRTLHNTTFSCSFIVGSVTTTGTSTVRVIVPVSSVRLTEPGTDVVITTENSKVTFICNASAAHPRPSITWYSDSRTSLDYSDDVEILKNISMRSDYDGYLYTVMSTLTLFPTKNDNGSSIYCNATNTETQSISSTNKALLNVQYPSSTPIFFTLSNVSLMKVAVIINSSLTIRCKSIGNPFPSYTWTTPQKKEVYGEELNIENIHKVDDGTYSCMAYSVFATEGINRNYSNSALIQVTVLFPPDSPKFYYIRPAITEQIGNSTINVVNGDDVSVLCNSSGKPHPVSVWNGHTPSDILSIKSVRVDVKSTCTSLNVMTDSAGKTRNGSNSRELKIIVLYPPDTPVIKNLLSEDRVEVLDIMTVIENSKLVLECSAKSKPHSSFTWSHSMIGNINLSKQLTLNRIKRNQSGAYTCLAKNEMIRSFGNKETGKNNRSIYIDVLYPPDFPTFYYLEHGNRHKINTLTLKVVEGDNVSVFCNATGNPTTTSVWMDGVENTDILTIDSVEIQQNPNISCKSFNIMHETFGKSRNGTSLKHLSIIVFYPPRKPTILIQLQPGSTQETQKYMGVIEGSNFRLYCHAVSNPSPSYKWTGPATSYHMSISAQLIVSNIQRNQSGPYICYAQNEMERSFGKNETGMNKQSLYFDILYKAEIRYFGAADFENNSSMMTVDQNEEMQIMCKVESNPFPNTTIFFKGRLVNETIRIGTVTYNLINSTCSDAGRYICKGKNEFNYQADASRELFLYVKCLPQPSADQPPEKNVSAALTDSAVFRFYAAPYYDPGITEFRWFKIENRSRILLRNGTKAYITSSDLHSVLRIIDVSEADCGMYILEYKNSVGMNSFIFYLQKSNETEEIYKGTDMNYLPMVIGIATAVLVIVGITLGIVIYIRRYQRKTDDGNRSGDNIYGINATSGETNSINYESVYEGLKPMEEKGYVEMKEQAYDILKLKDSVDTKDPVYTNLKI